MSHGLSGLGFCVALAVATAGLSAMLTMVAIRYALRRRLLDLPGQRRSHSQPTPRGGGAAIVVAMLAGGIALAIREREAGYMLLLLPPILGIAWVGWLDDHGGLSALKRLAMHAAAAAWIFAGSLPLFAVFPASDASSGVPAAVAALAVTFVVVWSINLHNFMDGIDGLLTLQAMFVLVVLAATAILRGAAGETLLLTCAAACAGFLPFNFPRARIFMGDVGSGVLGFVVGVGVLWQMGDRPIAAASGLVLCSAFVTDASCTLLSRMLRGRRWYSAHREHLYQWLVRSGFSHARVVVLYMAWNLLLVLPVVYWMNYSSLSSASSIGIAAAVYALAIATWWFGKRWCLATTSRRGRHAA